jgi:hypothetical protein
MLKQTNISERRACLLVEISRTVLHYTPKVRLENERLQGRMVELASDAAVLAIEAFMPYCGVKVLRSITNASFAFTRLPG